MFSCRMVDFQKVLTMCPKKGRFDLQASTRPEKDAFLSAGSGQTSRWTRTLPFWQIRLWSGIQVATIDLLTTPAAKSHLLSEP